MNTSLSTCDRFFTLNSGLRVSSLLVSTAPFVHLTLTLCRGVEVERVGQYGYLSLLSTLFSRGCGDLDRAAFATDCDRRGANLQFYPGRDFLTFEFWVLPEDLSWALETFRKMVWNPRLEGEEVEIAAEEQLLQLLARNDEKKSKLSDLCRQAFYAQDHPYARPLIGDQASLERVNQPGLVDFHRTFLEGIGAVLCVTGGFAQDSLEALLDRHFGDLHFSQEAARRAPSGAAFRTEKSKALDIDFPVDQAEILIALPALSRLDPRYRLAQFCNEAFGGAFLSRLTRAVRMREGMAYSADSRFGAGLQAGVFWIGVQTDRHKVRAALRTVRECMEELREGGLKEGEFKHFKDFLHHSMPFDYDALADLTSRRLEQILFGEAWGLEARASAFEAMVTLDSSNAMFGEILVPERAVVCVLGEGLEPGLAASFHAPISGFQNSAPLTLIEPPRAKESGPCSAEMLHHHSLGTLYRLSNGIHLLTLPRKELASVSLQVWTVTGSMDEPRGSSGISHLLEHLMFRGTEAHPDGQFDTLLAQKGGLNNAFTTEDFTVYLDYVTQQGLEEALCLEADRFSRLHTSEEIFQTELSVVLEERSLRVDCNPLGKAYEKLQELAFKGHPYGHPVIGWREDLEKMSLEAMREHYRKACQSDRLLVVIAGGCESEHALNLVSQTFGSLPGSPEPNLVPAWPVLTSPEPIASLEARGCELRDRSGYSYLLLAYRFPREGHPDYEACELLSRILGEGDSGRLYDVFVRQRRKVMEVWTSYESQSRDHPLLLFGLASPQALETDLLGEVGDYLAALSSDLSEEELEKARKTWLAEEAFGTDELEDWALGIAGRVMLLPWDQVWTQEEKILSVSLEEVKEVSQRYLKLETLVHVFLHGDSEHSEL